MESLVWHLKTISSLQQSYNTPFNVCCSLVLVCKNIIGKYGLGANDFFQPLERFP